MKRLRIRRPSPAMVVALIALAVATSGTAVAATGGTFILGKSNSAGHVSTLANRKGPALTVTGGGSATPLTVNAPAGVPPLAVNSSARVANLNADELDGLSASDLKVTAGSTGNFSGPLPQTIPDVNFTAPTTLLLISGSGYRGSAGVIELKVYACPGVTNTCDPFTTGNIDIGTRDLYTNEANSHKAIDMTVVSTIPPGTYSLGLYPSTATETDVSDQFSITVVNLG